MDRASIAAFICLLGLAGCVHLPDTAHGENVAAPSDGEITNATPLAAVIKARQVQPLDPASSTPLLDQAMVELAKTDDKQRYRGVTYNLTKDNVLDAQWLIQSPNVWGRPASKIAFMPLECKGACDADFHLAYCRKNSDCGAGAVCGHLASFDALPQLAGKRLCLGQADNLIERFYQGLMRCYSAQDRAPEAASVFRRLQRALAMSLGTQPSAQSVALLDQISTSACDKRVRNAGPQSNP